MVLKTSNLIFFRGLRTLDLLGGLQQPPRPLAVIFRKIHFHPCISLMVLEINSTNKVQEIKNLKI
jgi:hypothetical protein